MEFGAFFCSFIVFLILHTACSEKDTPPEITEPTQRLIQDHKSKTLVELKCLAESKPPSTYRWTFQGQKLNENGFTLEDVQVNEQTGVLTISSFSEDHQGNYQCLAENTLQGSVKAVAMSAVITLRMVVLSQATWPPGLQTRVTPKEGNYMNLTCDNPPVCVPEAQYMWYLSKSKDTSGSGGNKGDIKPSDRIYIDADGTLHFIYVKKEDNSDDLRYQCGVVNSALGLIRLGSEKIVEVEERINTIPETAPMNRYKTSPAKFFRTKEAILECVFSGNPLPTITWKDGQGKKISNDDKYEIVEGTANRKLLIKDLEWEDSGKYTCEAVNTLNGENPEIATIFLEVLSGPIWVASLSSKVVPENKEAVFTCKARSIDKQDQLDPPKWFKNGEPFDVQNDPKYEFSDNSRVLTVKNLNKATDIMCFQCNVSNNIGYEFADGCLTVIEPIVIIAQPELEQHITRGDQVNLTIIGKTDPDYTLKYRWYFKNVSYETPNNPPFVYFNETTMQAYINTSGLNDEDYWSINGTYIRELYHTDDKLNVSIEVILKELPPLAPIVAAGVDLWWIALIVALIVLIIVIILIVIICNRMRQEGTYPLDKKERSNDIDPEKDLADSGFQDLSRAPGDDDYPTKKSAAINPNFDYGDDMDMGDDDESLMEYGGADFDTTKFNEDGSFIGQYTSKNKTPEVKHNPVPLNHHATESQI